MPRIIGVLLVLTFLATPTAHAQEELQLLSATYPAWSMPYAAYPVSADITLVPEDYVLDVLNTQDPDWIRLERSIPTNYMTGRSPIRVGNAFYQITNTLDGDSLQIWDIIDPANPEFVDNHELPTTPVKIFQDENQILVYCVGESGVDDDTLRIMDVSDPLQPVFLQDFVVLDHDLMAIDSWQLYCDDNRIVYETDWDQINVIDLTDLNNPVIYENIFPDWSSPYLLSYRDNLLFTAEMYTVYVHDVSDPTNPVLLYQFDEDETPIDLQTFDTPDGVGGLARRWDGSEYYLASYSFSDPSEPILLDTLNTIQPIDYMVRNPENGLSALPGGRNGYGLMGLDTSDLSDLRLLYHYHGMSQIGQFDIKDDIAFVVDAWDGLDAIDVSDPAHPVMLSHLPIAGDHVVAMYHTLYVFDEDCPVFHLIDSSDPSNLTLIRDIQLDYQPFDADFQNHMLYVAAWNCVVIYDVTWSRSPVEITRADGIGVAQVEVNDDWMITTGSDYTQIHSLADPLNPVLRFSQQVEDPDPYVVISFTSATIEANRAYATVWRRHIEWGWDESELRCYDLSDPLNIVQDGTFSFADLYGGVPYQIAARWGYLYACWYYGGNGLYVLDLTQDPAQPEVIAQSTHSHSRGVLPGDDVIYNVDKQFRIFDMPTTVSVEDPSYQAASHNIPSRFTLSPVWPNPFNANARISVTMPAAGLLRVDLYDILGRRVLRLADSPVPAGRQSLRVNASTLPSGSYFIHAEANGQTRTKRVTLLK